MKNQRRNRRNSYKKEDKTGTSGFIIKEEKSQETLLPTADSIILERRNSQTSPNFKRRNKKAAN